MDDSVPKKTFLMRTFNQQFTDLLEDLERIFPTNNEVKIAVMNLTMIKKAKPSLIIHIWYKYIYAKYKSVIDAGDITVFFDKDYSEDLTKMKNAENIMKMIDKLRQPVKAMDGINREHTLKYIQILSKLSEAYSILNQQ